MKKIFLKIVIGVVLACILFVCFLYTNNEIGVTSSKLEADIRSSQKIKDDWTVDGSVSSTMAAYISYPQDLSDHSFSVYVNRPGLSFGYFFRGGGTLSGIQRGIEIFNRFQIFFQFIGNGGLRCTLAVLFMGFPNIPDNQVGLWQCVSIMPYAPKTGWTGDVSAKKNGQTNKIHLSIRFGGASGSRTLAPVSRPIAFRVFEIVG